MGDVFHIEIHVGQPTVRHKAHGPWVKLAVALIAGAAVVLAKVLPGMLSHEAPSERPSSSESHGTVRCEDNRASLIAR
jgi:hypothetical protein